MGRLFAILLSVPLLAAACPAAADWIAANGAERAPNFAEIAVLEDRVRITLEIDLGDAAAFARGGGEFGRGDAALSDPAHLAEAFGRSFRVEADGKALVPGLVSFAIRPRGDRPVPLRPAGMAPAPAGPPRSVEVAQIVLDYPFRSRPARLLLVPPLDERGMAVATVGFLAEHMGVAVTDYRYLGRAETLALDWDDPWYSAFENPVLARHHRSAVMSFVTVEPREVRHEIILRLRDLEALGGLEQGGADPLGAREAGDVLDAAAAFLSGRNPFAVDGTVRAPASKRAMFLRVSVEGVSVVEDPAGLDRRTALVGVVLSYPHDRLPGRVSVDWDVFPEGAEQIPVYLSDPAGAVPAIVRPDDPQVVWKNLLRTWTDPAVVEVRPEEPGGRAALAVPLVLAIGAAVSSLAAARTGTHRWRWGCLAILAGTATLVALAVAPPRLPFVAKAPEPGTAPAIAAGLVRNAAVSMLEVEPARFRQAVGVFVAPEALESVSAEIRRGLSVTLPSGALARTEAILDIAVEQIAPRGKTHSLLASWTAEGSGGHWGHLHRRRVHYRALMDVHERDGAWELNGLTILEARTAA